MALPSGKRSAKRKRADSKVELTSAHKRCIRGDPYLSDGDVIIVVNKTRFRIHGKALADLSITLAKLISEAQRHAEEGGHGGHLTVLELTDSADDWRLLLKSIFQRRYAVVFLKWSYTLIAAIRRHRCKPVETSALSLDTVATLLRLGSKYEIPQFRTEAVKRPLYEYTHNIHALTPSTTTIKLKDVALTQTSSL
jgi:hypothetical protein